MSPSSSSPPRRLNQILSSFSTKPSIGKLTLGGISFDVPAAQDALRLPHVEPLDTSDAYNLANLHFLLQKYLLGQDVFLVGEPGPYARRLAMTFCSLINAEYEHIALHRDVGETELKQGREIRAGGNLVYVDSAAVRAVKLGRILIIEGIEKAERGIMPVLNNLLENREINLDDGTHVLHPTRHALITASEEQGAMNFIPAHHRFRVIAIGSPVPPYKGYPLDPPFRSRFQARFIDNVASSLSLASSLTPSPLPTSFETQLQKLILAIQFAADARSPLANASQAAIPPFPQTALSKLRLMLDKFPAPENLNPEELTKLILCLHPRLFHAKFEGWASLSAQLGEVGLGELPPPSVLEGQTGNGGFMGYTLKSIVRLDKGKATVAFEGTNGAVVFHTVPCGPLPFAPFPPESSSTNFTVSPRFLALLTCFVQIHTMGLDISYVPPFSPSTASCSTSHLIRTFADVLGYELETVHLYKELGGRELLMRRKIESSGATSWVPSALTESAWEGRLVHLSGIDVVGPTAGSIARLAQDREIDLWEGRRIVASKPEEESTDDSVTTAHPSFRMICSASKSLPLRDWLLEEHSNMFSSIQAQPMNHSEELNILLRTGCSETIAKKLISFASAYRASLTNEGVNKNRKLGTRSLVRIARRAGQLPWDDNLHPLLCRALLTEFLPGPERTNVDTLLMESGIAPQTNLYNPPPTLSDDSLLFPEASDPRGKSKPTRISLFPASDDPSGVAALIPHMEYYYNNSLQTGLMRDMAIDLELLGEHLVLLGNQGVGKNKIIDRLCQLLSRPREYIQLHRDTTVTQLMFQTTLEGGTIRYIDSPLLRAIKFGRVIVIDEADKAPEHVVAVLKSLGGQLELSLSDGRRVRPFKQRDDDIVVHKNFRMILLANRPGYPFLGNQFLQVLGDNFSCHAVMNPDIDSELRLLLQSAPELDKDTVRKLVLVFHDLRYAFENGTVSYPYSLRELLNLVKHMRAYPTDSLEDAFRNIFDFDVYRSETMTTLYDILRHHGLDVGRVGLDAVRKASGGAVKDIKFEPTGKTDLDQPKAGKDDPDNKPHVGGNTWRGGTGGRDTAGMGGRGGYMRLYKGHDIHQVSQKLKDDVPEEIKAKAKEMARQELERKLQELNMSPHDARGYGKLLDAVQSHIASLLDLLENLTAKEEERVWIKRQIDGELDDGRLTDGLTGESTVYKRRGMEKPEMGKPQIKPKRIRFLFDVSGSMSRFQYDGRLQHSLEVAVMLMETFDRLSRKEKYAWDIFGHSGDGPRIPFVETSGHPDNTGDRWRVVEKMNMMTQYAFSGDYTVEAIEKSVREVAKFDADDWFVIAITDANFGRYDITLEDLKRVMNCDPKVNTALICIGDGSEATWIPKNFPGRGFRVTKASDIPAVMRSILQTMVEK